MNSVRNKLENILDQGSFKELWSDIHTYNYLEFTGYDEKLKAAKEKSGEKDSVITGTGMIAGCKCVIAAFEPLFMMGSMGLVAGEKIARAFRYATKKRLPVITFSSSGGARMQEGVISLMQMAKTSAAVHVHSKKNLIYISYIRSYVRRRYRQFRFACGYHHWRAKREIWFHRKTDHRGKYPRKAFG